MFCSKGDVTLIALMGLAVWPVELCAAREIVVIDSNSCLYHQNATSSARQLELGRLHVEDIVFPSWSAAIRERGASTYRRLLEVRVTHRSLLFDRSEGGSRA